MQKRSFTAQDVTGRVLPSASVRAYLANTTTPATIYDDAGAVVAQPLLTDTRGGFTVRIPEGIFDLGVTYNDTTATIEDVQFFDPGDYRYASRAALVSAWFEGLVPDGTIITDGTSQYIASSGATAIADLPGLMPFHNGAVPVDCFGTNANPGTTDMSAAVQAAVDYVEATYSRGAEIQFGLGVYRVENVRIQDDGVSFVGAGREATRIRNNSTTLPTFHFEAADSLTTTVERCHFRDMLLVNESTDPTTSVHIKAVRAKLTISGCELNNAFRGVELHGNPQGCRILDTDITQGSNTTTLQSGSCAVALLRAQVSTVTTADAGAAHSDPAAPSAVVGVWDASAGTFPAGASDGETYRVSVGGTVDSVAFAAGDYLEAITGSPSTTTYAANWEKTAVTGYYTEPNVVQIDNCDFESNNNGMDTVLLITCGDGVQVTNTHLGFGVNSIIEIAPIQSVIDFNAIQVSNNFFDPRIGTTDHCVWIRDRYSVGSSSLGAVIIRGNIFGSPDLDGVRVEFDCDNLNVSNNEFKNCGRHAIYVNDASNDNLIITDNSIFNSDAGGNNAAAINIAACGNGLIDGNTFRTGYRGIQFAAIAGLVIGEGNNFEGMTDRDFLPAASMPDDVIVPNRCRTSASNTIASGNDLNPVVGHDFFFVTGTTTIQTIRTASPNASINGRTITLRFNSALTVTHDHSGALGAGDMYLNGAANFSASAGDTLTLRCQSGVWYEIGRTT